MANIHLLMSFYKIGQVDMNLPSNMMGFNKQGKPGLNDGGGLSNRGVRGNVQSLR